MRADLGGKIAIITGAGSGIGRATSTLFAAAGAKVVLCDRSDAVYETARVIKEAGGTVTATLADAGSETDVAALVKNAVAIYGGLDVFYANAGTAGDAEGGIFDATAEDWLQLLRTNLVGPFVAIKYAAPVMNKRGGGSIICTASIAGISGGAGPAHYSASKAGVINLVKSACQQLVGTHIRVNAICPGLIATAMTKSWYDEARAAGTDLGECIPEQRGGDPEEVAAVALFLASDASSYINGQQLIVDGGLTSGVPSFRPLRAADVQVMLGP
jgi:NAD(P)-dependent dehydrogenase (short-subunit alcohol dehydrogenase family)